MVMTVMGKLKWTHASILNNSFHLVTLSVLHIFSRTLTLFNNVNMQMFNNFSSVYTVRPNTVAGEAGHVRLERPIDSSSDKTVCAPKVAEKGPYSRDLINKPLTDPDFCSCCQHVPLFSRGIWEIHAEFLAFFVQNLQIISHNSCH